MLTVLTPAYAGWVEQTLISFFSGHPRMDNIASGGGGLPKDETVPIFVYMACRSNHVEPEHAVIGSLAVKSESP